MNSLFIDETFAKTDHQVGPKRFLSKYERIDLLQTAVHKTRS